MASVTVPSTQTTTPTVNINTTKAQMSALSLTQIAALTPTQVAALTSTQISGLSDAQVQALNGAGLVAAQLSYKDASGKTLISVLTATQIKGLAPTEFAKLTVAQMTALPQALYAGITNAQIQRLSSAQAQVFLGHTNWLTGMQAAQLVNVIGAITGNFTAAQINGFFTLLTPTYVSTLSGNDLSYINIIVTSLPIASLQSLTASTVGGLSASIFSAMMTQGSNEGYIFPRIAALDISRVAGATLAAAGSGFIRGLSQKQVAGLNSAQAAALTSIQISSLSATQLQAISVANIPVVNVMDLRPAQIATLTPAQVGALTSTQISSLSDAQVQAFNGAGLVATQLGYTNADGHVLMAIMSKDQVAALAPMPLAKLSAAQLASLITAKITSGVGATDFSGAHKKPTASLITVQDLIAYQGGLDELKFAITQAVVVGNSAQDGSNTPLTPDLSWWNQPVTDKSLNQKIWDQIRMMSPDDWNNLSSPRFGPSDLANSHTRLQEFIRTIEFTASRWAVDKQRGSSGGPGDGGSGGPGDDDPDDDADSNDPLDRQSDPKNNTPAFIPSPSGVGGLKQQLSFDDLLKATPGEIVLWRMIPETAQMLGQIILELSPEQSAQLSRHHIEALGPLLSLMSSDAISGLSLEGVSGLSPEVLMLRDSRGAHIINHLSQYQLQHVEPAIIAKLYLAFLRSPLVPTTVSVLASLTYLQLSALSTSTISRLSLSDLQQDSVLSPGGQTISVLQALPWSSLTAIRNSVVRSLSAADLALTNLQEQALGLAGHTVLAGLSTDQIAQLSLDTVSNLSAAQLNTSDANGNVVWQDLLLNPAQASYLPSAYQWANLTSTQVTSLLTSLAQTDSIANLNPTVFTAIPTASLVNGILGMGPAASAWLISLSNAQLAALSPTTVNALITGSGSLAMTLLNAGGPNALSIEQFQALILGNTNIGQINERVLGNTLSVQALLSMTTAQITQLTGGQWQAILSNPTLSKVVYNAGSGDGYWTTQQLQAVAGATVSYTTQGQYLQFAGGLAMFSRGQQDAMSTNVYLLEIMVTGYTNGWTQEQIAQMVQDIPGMMPLSTTDTLPGGGCEHSSNVKEPVEKKYQVTNWAKVSREQIAAMLSNPNAAGTTVIDGDELNELLHNPQLPAALAGLDEQGLINVLSSATLLPGLTGDSLMALITPINAYLAQIPEATRNGFARLRQDQMTALGTNANGGAAALAYIARYARASLPNNGVLTTELLTALIAAQGGAAALAYIARYARASLPNNGVLTTELLTALIAAQGGAAALAYIVQYASASLANGVLTTGLLTALIAAQGGAAALADIARYARASLANGALTTGLLTALIATEGGADALADIAQYARASLPNNGVLTTGLLTALIAAQGGAAALADIARYARASLPNNGVLTTGLLTALIAAQGGAAALANIAQYASASLPNGVLTTGLLTALIATEGGANALANIALYASASLANGVFTEGLFTALIAANGGTNVLANIAQYASASLPNGVLTTGLLTALIATQGGANVLANIALYASASLANGVFTEGLFTALIATQGGTNVLANIAQYASASLPNGVLTTGLLTALIATEGGANALARIAQYASASIPDGALTTALLTALIAANGGAYTLARIARYARASLANGALTTGLLTALIAANGGVNVLVNIAQYASASLANGVFTEGLFTALIATQGGTNVLVNIAQYASASLANGVLTTGLLTALIAANGGADALANIAQYASASLANGALTTELFTALIAANGGIAALVNIAQYASASLPNNGALTTELLTALIATKWGAYVLANIARYASASLANGALTTGLLTALIATEGGADALVNIAQYASASLPNNGVLTTGLLTALIAAQGGADALANIAQYASASLANGALTTGLLTALIATEGGADALANIARYARASLPNNGVLTTELLTALIAAQGGADALANIAQYARASLPNNGVLTTGLLTALIATEGGADALANIARYARASLPNNGVLTTELLTALIAAQGGADALARIARYARASLPNNGVLTTELLTALIAAQGGADALANIAQYASASLPNGALTIGLLTALIAANGSAEALINVTYFAPNALQVPLTPDQRAAAIAGLPQGAMTRLASNADFMAALTPDDTLLFANRINAYPNSLTALNPQVIRAVLNNANLVAALEVAAAINLATCINSNGQQYLRTLEADQIRAIFGNAALISQLSPMAVVQFMNSINAHLGALDNLTAQQIQAMLNNPSLAQRFNKTASTRFAASANAIQGVLNGLNAQQTGAVLSNSDLLNALNQGSRQALAMNIVNSPAVLSLFDSQASHNLSAYPDLYNQLPQNLQQAIQYNAAPMQLHAFTAQQIRAVLIDSAVFSALNSEAVVQIVVSANAIPTTLSGLTAPQIQAIISNPLFMAALNEQASRNLGNNINIAQMVAGLSQDRLVSILSNNSFMSTIDGPGTLELVGAIHTLLTTPGMQTHYALLAPLNQAQLNALANGNAASRHLIATIAQEAPGMLRGVMLSSAQMEFLTPADFISIARFEPMVLPPIQITQILFDQLRAGDAPRMALDSLIQNNRILGFDQDVLTSGAINALVDSNLNQGAVAALIANGHLDWINPGLAEVQDRNIRALFQASPGASQLNAAAQNGATGYANLYAAISQAQGGAYTLSGAAFAAYATTDQGVGYLNWLIANHPGTLHPVVRPTSTVGQIGLSASGLSTSLLSASGNAFWNQYSDLQNSVWNPNSPDNYINAMADFRRAGFDGWSISTIQALAQNAINGGQSGFLGTLFSPRSIAAGTYVSASFARAIAVDPSIFNAYATSAPFVLNALVPFFSVTNGSVAAYASLTADGLAGLIAHGQDVLADASAAQISAIASNILAGLTPTQAALLPQEFWQNITAPQLTAMFNSPTLGVAFFSAVNTLGHISQVNLDAIDPAVLAQSVVAATPAIQTSITSAWNQLTALQQAAITTAIPDIAPNNELGFAGDSQKINQQIISGASLLTGQTITTNNATVVIPPQGTLTELQDLILTHYQGEVATGATWTKGATVTVSATGFTGEQMGVLSGALSQYAAMTGLTFQMVATGGQIDLGFANLHTGTTGSVGWTTINAVGGQMQSAQIYLADPAQDPINPNDNIYDGTQASFSQALLHELGHALGLDDNNMTGSIANYYLGSDNQTLNANDITALQALYGVSSNTGTNFNGPSATPITVTALHQLAQAMANSHTPVGMVSTSTGTFMSAPGTNNPLTLLSSTVH